VDGTVSQENTALRAQIEQARARLEAHEADLRVVDDEFEALAPRRRQHELLEQACGSLEQLEAQGVASLFWGERAEAGATTGHLRLVRERIDAFRVELAALETRRRGVLAAIDRAREDIEILGEDLYDFEQQEARRREEWLVEREPDPLPTRPAVMPWARGGEDDWRFRKALAVSVLASALLGVLLPMIELPLPRRDAPVVVPERLVQLVREEQAKPVPPPRVAEVPPPPEQAAQPEQKAREAKPSEQPSTPSKGPGKPGPRGPQPEQAYASAQPQDKPAGKPGLLAFRDTFASLAKDDVAPKLGAGAHINDTDDAAPGQVQRSMLTSNAPGSSGGINLASISRNSGRGGGGGGGGGGGAGALAGVQVGRAASSIGGGGGGGGGGSDRPLASDASASRTDEEIQIVFDRYKAALYRLYNRELRKDPSLRGQMVLRLTIEPDGSVSMCALQSSDMDAPELSAQVVDRVRGINFGAKDVDSITIVYPIDFLPAA
jgi:hypothetical protein